jgi:transcription termination factor Rho
MSDTQLERSVLEAKERDELFAIADALGAKPAARAKKSDLITQILKATGIEPGAVDAPSSSPSPSRRSSAASSAASTSKSGGGSDAPETDGRAGSDGSADPGAEQERPRRPRTRRAAPAAAPSAEQAETAEPAAPAEAGGVAEVAEVVEAAAAAAVGDTRPAQGSLPMGADATATARPERQSAEAPQEAQSTNRGATSTRRASPPRTPEDQSGNGGGAAGDGGRSTRNSQPAASGSEGPGRNGANGAEPAAEGAGARRGPVATSSDDATDGGGDSAQGQTGVGAEPGNRRNRRRRGRDRFDRAERDLPGQTQESQFNGDPIPVAGYLDLREEGYGFLRTAGFLSGPGDVYVSISQVRRFALRKGDYLEGAARPAGGNEKYPALLRIDTVSGLTPDEARTRPRFENLTPLFPDSKMRLEVPGDPANLTARIVDLISPIGKGQRGMIVSPPKAGKTTILKQIAHSIEANDPEVHLMVLLVDERPEEVTDMRRSVKGEVIASTFDRPAEEHTQVAELAIERAKRMVEVGKDVVIVLDGITRLARAYNLAQPATGRIMSGGIDTGALYPPKKFFGAARNIEEGGSLTILATALVETGSRMDEVIFEEFKGTGNMELRLDRRLAERRIYPAIDVNASSTRHEELLFDRVQLQQVWKLRRVLNALASEGSGAAGLELLLDRIRSTRTNDEFLAEVAKNPTPAI